MFDGASIGLIYTLAVLFLIVATLASLRIFYGIFLIVVQKQTVTVQFALMVFIATFQLGIIIFLLLLHLFPPSLPSTTSSPLPSIPLPLSATPLFCLIDIDYYVVRSVYFFTLPSGVNGVVSDYVLVALPTFLYFTAFSLVVVSWYV